MKHTGIEEKLDSIIDMLDKLSVKFGDSASNPKPAFPELSVLINELSSDSANASTLDWSSVDNIIDLTGKIEYIRFFASTDNTKACICCQTCFDYLCMEDRVLRKLKEQGVTGTDNHAIDAHIRK